MVAIKNILFFAVTASASVLPLFERAGVNATATADITKIKNDINALTAAANKYNGGGISNALPVQQAYSNLDDAINASTKDANSFAQQDTYTSRYIISQIKAVEPLVNDAVNAIIAKKSQFTTDGVAGLVGDDVATLKKDTDSLADALIAKASADQKAAGKNVKTTLDSYFAKAAKAFPPSS